MKINGSDCIVIIKTENREISVPYTSETIREAVVLLKQNACIEGNGSCKGIKLNNGITGCIVTPLMINTVPILIYLVMGNSYKPVYISETRNLYKQCLNLLPMEDSPRFDLIHDRGNKKLFFENCLVKSFELRIHRYESMKLKMEVTGEKPSVELPYADNVEHTNGERFDGDSVKYEINGQEYKNIYGITLTVEKNESTRTELTIKRSLEKGSDIPEMISEMVITAQLYREKYEDRYYGTFRIILKKLVLTGDETVIDASDTVMGPLRYFIIGTVMSEVFYSGDY